MEVLNIFGWIDAVSIPISTERLPFSIHAAQHQHREIVSFSCHLYQIRDSGLWRHMAQNIQLTTESVYLRGSTSVWRDYGHSSPWEPIRFGAPSNVHAWSIIMPATIGGILPSFHRLPSCHQNVWCMQTCVPLSFIFLPRINSVVFWWYKINTGVHWTTDYILVSSINML